MIFNTKRWHTASPISPEAEDLLHSYPPILRQILFNRGFATHEAARQYLEAQPPPDSSPDMLLGIGSATDRIMRAVRKRENIAIYGDYDADGVTATALLMVYFQSIGASVRGYIPNRFEEGYGLNIDALDLLKNEGASLVITVDCGIRSLLEADHARKIGLDLIISDHHQPGPELPAAIAVINPKQPGDPYPDKDLAGVGLAYKLIEGLNANSPDTTLDHHDFLDLVALGTVADLAPLVGENRYLVREGLHRIRRPQRQGILSLIGVSGLTPAKITSTDLGFALGPRINAAGRLDSAQAAVTLLTTNDVRIAANLAQELDNQNRERQRITRAIQEHAGELAFAKNPDAQILIAVHPDFNPGVVGLAASRLTDVYYRPSIVGHMGDELTRASCRSIQEFHITNALERFAGLLEHFGGHAAAAGFTVRNENLDELMDGLQMLAAEELSGIELRPAIIADLEVSLSDLTPDVIKYLEWVQPTGYGNPRALFTSRDLVVKASRTVGKESSHLKMTITDGWITFDAIGFRLGYWQENMPKRVDLMFNFEVNEFRGRETLQLNVRDLKPAGSTL